VLALRLHPDRQLRLHDEPIPEPGPGEALLRIRGVGLCGSDRHWVVDGGIGDAVLDTPLVLGHEFDGVVESGSLRGRRVAVDPAVSCGTCEPCIGGAENLCLRVRFAGHGQTDGALREYIAWPERSLYPLSDALDERVGPLVEPLAVAIHGVDLGRLHAGATVAVIGCGPIGLLVIALARAAGVGMIVATDPSRVRLDAATSFGATHAIEAGGTSADGEAVLATTKGRGLDVVFEAAGDAPAVDCAVTVAAPGARVVLLGIPPDDRTTFNASAARRKGLTLKLTRRSTHDSFRRAVALAEAGAIDLAGLVTLRVPLTDGARGFDALVRRDGIKTLIEPGGDTPSPSTRL
jgi:L-iditol 2-dehydrogenase